MCWNYAYLIFSLEHQCVRNLNNNATHIYIVEMYDVMVDSHTLFTYPCSMLFDKYDTNAAPKSFYMCQIYDHPFHQTFYLVYLGLNLLVSSSNNPMRLQRMTEDRKSVILCRRIYRCRG